LEKLYTPLGAQRIDIPKITWEDENKTYSSGLFVQRELWKTYRKGFSKDLRTFLQRNAA
jgi:hypothetical protein